MLYALGVGMGSDPLNEEELQFVNEAFATSKPLKVIPTVASVCVWGAHPGVIDLNRVMVVDGERDITFHKPMPVSANVTADARVRGIYDKGKEKVRSFKTRSWSGMVAVTRSSRSFRRPSRGRWRLRRPIRGDAGTAPGAPGEHQTDHWIFRPGLIKP